MRENRFYPVSARRRPLPGALSTHRGPVPHHRAQQNLQAVPLALDGPYVLYPGERLHDYLRAFYLVFKGEPTLFIIDDCSATKALTKKKDMLSELAFSGRHADISVCVLTQKYNSVLKDLREQTRWVALFHCKNRDSFEDCLRENDVISTREQRALGAAAASRQKTRQASVENRSACCLYSYVAMLPVTEGLLIAVLGTHLVLLVFVAWQIAQCLRRVALHIRRARRLAIAMDCDELIDELMSVGAGAGLTQGGPPAAVPAGGTAATPDAPEEEERAQKHRERLAANAVGGQAGQYGLVVRGKAFTADQIDALDNSEIEKLYARYEARLGAAMTKTLGSAALLLYAGIAVIFLPIENQPGLIADLEGDPFVGHALSSANCELYHRYGMF